MGLTSVQQKTKQTQPVPQQLCVFMVSSVIMILMMMMMMIMMMMITTTMMTLIIEDEEEKKGEKKLRHKNELVNPWAIVTEKRNSAKKI